MNELKLYLSNQKAGPLKNTVDLETRLAAVWHEIVGYGDGGMAGHKLIGRMEDVRWDDPVLKFKIERHGGTVNGSTRAEIQHWKVDLNDKAASIMATSHRQLYSMADRITKKDMAGLVEEIVTIVVTHAEDERLRWKKDGSVHIIISKIFPDSSGFKQTVQSRRKRFRTALTDALNEKDWNSIGNNVFQFHRPK